MKPYTTIKEKHLIDLKEMSRKYSLFGLLRFIMVLIIIVSLYYYFNVNIDYLWIPAVVAFVALVRIVKSHTKLADEVEIKETLVQINKDEIEYLSGDKIPFDNGVELNDHQHNYALDLDIFGPHSIFHNLNRTATYIGKSTLAKLFLGLLPNQEITRNQNGIQELSTKIEWRQDLSALGKLTKDGKKVYGQLIDWSKSENTISSSLKTISYVLPALFIIIQIAAILLSSMGLQYLAGLFFVINLSVLFNKMKMIQKELFNVDKVHEVISKYSMLMKSIESQEFNSDKLKDLQNDLKYNDDYASTEIHQLSALLSSLGSIQNLLGAAVMNGISLYHIHVYHALLKWKKEHAQAIEKWMKVIGEFEALNSLANFSHNNPSFCFPELNENYNINFEDLGHPLITDGTRICNDISFDENKFIILTGSNMSGKSTFLRSLGVNMMLSGIGSAVCASKANVHPLNIFVSMRQSDSLAENESYFFAEVKRLKLVMSQLKDKRGFVLLDEILRGTNSDDKRSGTIEVIKKMVTYNAIGAIATHDIEVCNTTDDYKNYLMNKRFETEIVNDELFFDYKIKEGVCKNKSAYFLMKKMEVI